MITLPWIGGGMALALIAGGLAGWTARDWKADADQLAARDKAEVRADKQREAGLAQGMAFATFTVANDGQTRADSNTIRETFREIHVPSDCAAPAGLVGLLRARVDEANRGIAPAPTGEPVSALPGPSAPAGPADRP